MSKIREDPLVESSVPLEKVIPDTRRALKQVEAISGAVTILENGDFCFGAVPNRYPGQCGVQESLCKSGFPPIDSNCKQPLAYLLLSLSLDHFAAQYDHDSDDWWRNSEIIERITDYMGHILMRVVRGNRYTTYVLTDEEFDSVAVAIANFRDYETFDPVPKDAEFSGQ